MRILPLIYFETLSEDDIAEHNCSDRIWVSNNEFRRLMRDDAPGIVKLLRFENAVGQYVVGSLHGHHNSDDEIVFAPQWMCDKLDLANEFVDMEPYEAAGLCTRLTLQPHTSDHLHTEDPQELLRDAFERYSCLEEGETIDLWIGKPFTVTIQGLQPYGGLPLCIRNCEIELELLPPLDLPLPPPPAPAPPPSLAPSPPPTPVENVFATTVGHPVGGEINSEKSKAELMREAALKRLKHGASQI